MRNSKVYKKINIMERKEIPNLKQTKTIVVRFLALIMKSSIFYFSKVFMDLMCFQTISFFYRL